MNAVEPAESSAKPPSDVIVVDLLDRDLRLAASACKQVGGRNLAKRSRESELD